MKIIDHAQCLSKLSVAQISHVTLFINGLQGEHVAYEWNGTMVLSVKDQQWISTRISMNSGDSPVTNPFSQTSKQAPSENLKKGFQHSNNVSRDLSFSWIYWLTSTLFSERSKVYNDFLILLSKKKSNQGNGSFWTHPLRKQDYFGPTPKTNWEILSVAVLSAW